jgi:quinol monooxygenase YgiN
MISINFVIRAKPRMNLELLQVMGSIMVNLHKIEGCLNIDFKQDKLNKDQFYFRMDWQNNVFFNSLLNSKEFGIFEGSLNTLCYNPKVEIIGKNNSVLRIIKENYKRELQKEFNN